MQGKNREGITLKNGKYFRIFINEDIAIKEKIRRDTEEQIITINGWDRERTAQHKHVGKEIKKC